MVNLPSAWAALSSTSAWTVLTPSSMIDAPSASSTGSTCTPQATLCPNWPSAKVVRNSPTRLVLRLRQPLRSPKLSFSSGISAFCTKRGFCDMAARVKGTRRHAKHPVDSSACAKRLRKENADELLASC